MGKSSSPQPVDPYQSAGAQYTYGTAAADYTKGLNATNQITPYGQTTWTRNPSGVPNVIPSTSAGPQEQPGGMYDISNLNGPGGFDPQISGNYFAGSTAPQYTETQTLSPEEQNIFNLMEEGRAGQAIAQGGAQQTADLLMPQTQQSLLDTPQLQTQAPGANDLPGEYQRGFNTALQGNLAAITPTLNAQYEQLDASLRNAGAHPGDPAYDTAMKQFMAGEGNELTQAAGGAENTGLNIEGTLFGQGLQGAQFGNQSKIEQQQLPLQNFLALESGATPGGAGAGIPPLGGTGGSTNASVQSPDIMSAFNTQYQGELNKANAQNASANADTGAAASLIGSYLMYLALA